MQLHSLQKFTVSNQGCCLHRLVLNCVGPFRLYGEPVVAACAAAGTDYLDVTGDELFPLAALVMKVEFSVLAEGTEVAGVGMAARSFTYCTLP